MILDEIIYTFKNAKKNVLFDIKINELIIIKTNQLIKKVYAEQQKIKEKTS